MRHEDLTPCEWACAVVCSAFFHARGDCQQKEQRPLVVRLFHELADRAVITPLVEEGYLTGVLPPRRGEAIGAAIFRHVLRETGQDPEVRPPGLCGFSPSHEGGREIRFDV